MLRRPLTAWWFMETVADFLDANRSVLIGRWKERVHEQLTLPALTDPELIDRLPQILEELSGALRTGKQIEGEDAPTQSRAVSLAQAHGRQRYRTGFDLRQLVREYGMLRDCVVDFLEESQRVHATMDLLVIGQFITNAISESVAEFVEAHQNELRARVDFEEKLVAIVSHDLRNPLGAIQLASHILLEKDDLNQRQEKIVARIQSSSARASRLVEDLLDFSAARFGKGLALVRTRFDLHAVVRDVVDEIRVVSGEPELRLLQSGDGFGDWDEGRVTQVVANLVNNALTYRRPNTPVSIRTTSDTDDVVISVHNDGDAIPPEKLERLFEPLVRGSREAPKGGRNIGLGLFIVDQIARAHGGRVSVRSTQENGTTFTVRLPRTVRP